MLIINKLLLYLARAKFGLANCGSKQCTDPESFVRGGFNFDNFFVFVLFFN